MTDILSFLFRAFMVRAGRLFAGRSAALLCIGLVWLAGMGLEAQTGRGGIIAEKLTAVPATVHVGQKFTLIFTVHVQAGYHIQSAHPLDPAFIPTQLTAKTDPSVKFGAVQYPQAILLPASTAITTAGKISVYENDVKFTIPGQVKPGAPTGHLKLSVEFQAQACNSQSCFMPVDKTFSVPLTVLPAAAGAVKTGSQPAVKAGSLNTGGSISAAAAPLPAARTEMSHPGSRPRQSLSVAEQVRIINSRPYHVAGRQLPVWELVLFALLGGLILNVMPCVLPVIPLKVLSLVHQAHGNRKWAVVHALVFSAGVISLFAGLAVAMSIYRAVTHHHLMYGMQNGNPVFLFAIGLIVLALGLSMLGVWTISAPRAISNVQTPQTGLIGSFCMGLLATILATPCSAPYLGPLLTVALGESAAVMVLYFILIGVGMAVPYIILAAFPQLLSRVPRAGRWSELLKQALGLVMVGVAAYLFSSLQTHHALMVALAIAVVLGSVLWVWGQAVNPGMPEGRIWSIRFAALAAGVALAAGIWIYNGGLLKRTTNASGRWQAFSLHKLDSALRHKRPVVVDFTAAWCINCKYVKHFVLDTSPVRRSFKRADALLLRADLTREPPVEKALLYKLGWRSIPVLAIFSPAHPYSPVLLHDIYSAQAVQNAVHQAGS